MYYNTRALEGSIENMDHVEHYEYNLQSQGLKNVCRKKLGKLFKLLVDQSSLTHYENVLYSLNHNIQYSGDSDSLHALNWV